MKEVFLKYLGDKVRWYRTAYSLTLTEGKAFGLWYAVDSLELEGDEAYEASSFARRKRGQAELPPISWTPSCDTCTASN